MYLQQPPPAYSAFISLTTSADAFQQPFVHGPDHGAPRSRDVAHFSFKREREARRAWLCVACRGQRAKFTRSGIIVGEVGAHLNERLAAIAVAGEHVDLEASNRFHVRDFGASALKFVNDDGFQGVSRIGAPTRVKALINPGSTGYTLRGLEFRWRSDSVANGTALMRNASCR